MPRRIITQFSGDLLRPLRGMHELDMAEFTATDDMTPTGRHEGDPVYGNLGNQAGITQGGF